MIKSFYVVVEEGGRYFSYDRSGLNGHWQFDLFLAYRFESRDKAYDYWHYDEKLGERNDTTIKKVTVSMEEVQ